MISNLKIALLEILNRTKPKGCVTKEIHAIAKKALEEHEARGTAENLKRYEFTQHSRGMDIYYVMERDVEGDYCLYQDVKELTKQI